MSSPAKYRIQSLIFDIKKQSPIEVVEWLKSHGFKHEKLDVMKEGFYWRARQLSPQYLRKIGYGDFRTITLSEDEGIKMVLAYPKEKKVKEVKIPEQ